MEETEPEEEAPLVTGDEFPSLSSARKRRGNDGASPRNNVEGADRNGRANDDDDGRSGGGAAASSDARRTTRKLLRRIAVCGTLARRRPLSSRRRLLLCSALATLFLLVVDVARNARIIYVCLWEYRWSRFLKAMRSNEPNAALGTTLASRREAIDTKRHAHGRREDALVRTHLEWLERDMGGAPLDDSTTVPASSMRHSNKTVVLLWSGEYPVWMADVRLGKQMGCNVPCEWTTDREYNAKRADEEGAEVTAVACMLSGPLCRDITPRGLREVGITTDVTQFPILGITWENNWRGGYDYSERPAGIDESVPSQLDRLQKGVPYNLIASHELDAHVPVLYPDIADLVDRHEITTLEELLEQQRDEAKMDSVYFAISNCWGAPLRPDRLAFIKGLGRHYPIDSFGKCLANSRNRAQPWNAPSHRDKDLTLEEMSRHRFVYTPENSYGIDYVTEKVYRALLSGSVPIYLGAPNVDAFLPDRDAVIYASDFDSPKALGTYLWELSRNVTLLAERHLMWRTRPLPERFLRLSKLVDRKSEHSFACKVCNCVRGRIGCPDIADMTGY